MKILPINETYKVENHPYGYHATSDKLFSIEYKASHGFRLVTQTTNPKTGVLNKPKKSTYYDLQILAVDDNGKVSTITQDFYGDEGKDKGYKFLSENADKFTEEQIKNLAVNCIGNLKVDIYAKATYCGSDTDKLLPLYDVALGTLVKIAKTGDNLWSDVKLDWKAIEALEIPDYKPFKITSYGV